RKKINRNIMRRSDPATSLSIPARERDRSGYRNSNGRLSCRNEVTERSPNCVLQTEAIWIVHSNRYLPPGQILSYMPDPIQLISTLLDDLGARADIEESAEWYLRSNLIDYK